MRHVHAILGTVCAPAFIVCGQRSSRMVMHKSTLLQIRGKELWGGRACKERLGLEYCIIIFCYLTFSEVRSLLKKMSKEKGMPLLTGFRHVCDTCTGQQPLPSVATARWSGPSSGPYLTTSSTSTVTLQTDCSTSVITLMKFQTENG